MNHDGCRSRAICILHHKRKTQLTETFCALTHVYIATVVKKILPAKGDKNDVHIFLVSVLFYVHS